MLVLTRKVGEKVAVGDGDLTVIVQVVAVKSQDGGARVRLGFEADESVSISRIEIDEDGNEFRVRRKQP